MARPFLHDVDLTLNELQNFRVQAVAVDPSALEARVVYHNVDKVLKFYNNTAWISLGRLDQISAPTNDVSLNSKKIVNLLDPTNPQDAATKAYVDLLNNNKDYKDSVRAATTANISLAGGAPNTSDGVTLALNDRMLVKDQSTPSQNGIYYITTLGTGANGTWTRATDADSNSEVTPGIFVSVEEGTLYGNSVWMVTTDAVITLGSTSIVWTRIDVGNDSITFAKMQNIATDRLIGRDTAGTGDPEEISLDTTLEFTGSASIRRAALTGDVTASAGSNATTIANDVVTNAKLRDSAALSVIGRSANSVGDPGDITTSASSGAVLRESGGTIAFGQVATAGFTDDSVTDVKLRNSAALSVIGRSVNSTGDPADITGTASSDAVLRISGTSLGFGTIATAGHADNSITFPKMQDIATDTLIGRDTAGTGDPETITLNATLSMTGAGALQRAALTGDVTASAGSNATSIAANAVTNAKLAQMAAATVKGRASGAGTGDPTDLTAAQLITILTAADGAGSLLDADFLDGFSTAVAGTANTIVLRDANGRAQMVDPAAAQDIATKGYVDSVLSGNVGKTTARVATTGSETYTIAGGAVTLINGTTIDGVTINVNDRILVKDAPASSGAGSPNSTQPANGVYVVTNATTNLTVTRAADFDTSAEVQPGLFVFASEGTANGDNGYTLTTNATITLNTTALTFTQTSGAGQITAGGGLTKTGNTLDIVAADGSITVNADSITVGLVPISKGGTNAITAAAARTSLAVPGQYAASFGDGASLTYNIDHNLNSLDCEVALYRNSDGLEVETQVVHSTANRVILSFNVAPTSNQYRVVVHANS